MFLKQPGSECLIRIIDINELIDPGCARVAGCSQAGEEEQDVDSYDKTELQFASGEPLPKCWLISEHSAATRY